jgi:hypothetical protein
MAYTKTYIFGESQSVGALISGGDRALLTIALTIEGTGSNSTTLASAVGLYIHSYGKTRLAYDYDNYYLVPKEYEFSLYDPNNILTDLLFDGANADNVNKNFFVRLELKYKGAANYEEEFSGNVIPEMIEEPDRLNNVLTFSAVPDTNIINQSLIYSKEWDAASFDAANGRESSWPLNPLELAFNKVGSASKWDWIKIKDVITKIFKLVNPSVNVNYYQNWIFYGSTGPEYPIPILQKYDLTFDDLIADHNHIGGIFGSTMLADLIKNCGDLLKMYAFEFGAMAGMISNSKAFFKQVFYFDENNVQTIERISSDNYKRKYSFNKYEFVDIRSTFYEQDLGNSNRFVPQTFKPSGFAPYERLKELGGENGLEKTIITVADYQTGILFGNPPVSNLKAAVSGNPSKYYSIFGVRCTDVAFAPGLIFGIAPTDGNGNIFLSLSHFLANYHYAIKGKLYKSQVYEFEAGQRNVDFEKGFTIGSDNFSILELEKDIDSGFSMIGAIKVSTMAPEVDDGTGGGVVITNPLGFGVYTAIAGQYSFSVASITGGDINISAINEKEILEEIIVLIERAFNTNEIATFRIKDGSGDLFTEDDVIDNFTLANSFSKPIYKKYAGADTLKMNITSGGGSASSGQGLVILKKLKLE